MKMKKIMIGVVAGICLLMTSCGNMNQVLSAMTNGTGVVNAITSVIGLDKVSAQSLKHRLQSLQYELQSLKRKNIFLIWQIT